MDRKRVEVFDGNIPALLVSAESMPEAHEKSLVTLYQQGIGYAREGPKDKGREQVDSTMTIYVRNPGSNLFFHKFLGTIPPQNILAYAYEILGAKDCLAVQPKYDPAGDTRWEYTYHKAYAEYGLDDAPLEDKVDQIAEVIRKLADEPHKRNSQMITWRPKIDLKEDAPACKQRSWFFPVPMPDGSYMLNLTESYRSRNPMTAAPINLFGSYVFVNWMAEQVQARIWQRPEQRALPEEKRTKMQAGRIVDFSDSYHVSAHDMHLLEAFIGRYEESLARGETIKDRVFTRDHYFMIFQDMLFNTHEVKDTFAQEIKNRYEERMKSHPEFNAELTEEQSKALQKLDSIDSWLKGFIK